MQIAKRKMRRKRRRTGATSVPLLGSLPSMPAAKSILCKHLGTGACLRHQTEKWLRLDSPTTYPPNYRHGNFRALREATYQGLRKATDESWLTLAAPIIPLFFLLAACIVGATARHLKSFWT